MPLSSLQSKVLSLLAAQRNPESFVAGASPLAVAGPRYSRDIDIFQDRADQLEKIARADLAILQAAGIDVDLNRVQLAICAANVRADEDATRIEWVVDSDFRFFPAVPDPVFGYALHLADIAANKALASAGRREPRDLLDLLLIHERYLPLGAVAWAASGKDPGFTPEGILAEISRSNRYQQSEVDELQMDTPVDAAAVSRTLKTALREANEFVRAMPAGMEGLLFLEDGRPVQPDPAHLDRYITHAGRRRGHWPSSSEIASAMLERGQWRTGSTPPG